MGFFDWLSAHALDIFNVATAVVAAASVIANATPTETDNKIVNVVGKIVNFFALYFHNPDTKTVTPAAK